MHAVHGSSVLVATAFPYEPCQSTLGSYLNLLSLDNKVRTGARY